MAKMFQKNMVNKSKIRTNLLLVSQPKSSNLHFEGKGLYCQKMQKLDTPQNLQRLVHQKITNISEENHLIFTPKRDVFGAQNSKWSLSRTSWDNTSPTSKTICIPNWREVIVLVVMFTSQCGCLKLHTKKPGEKTWFGNTCNLGPRSLPSRTLVTTHL